VIRKIEKSVRKNWPEVAALITGKMPQFVYGVRNFRDIPVFCFHSARYPLFDKQLDFLRRNNYRTLDSEELLQRLTDRSYRNDGRDIVLTFDDGMASVWTVAFPLLQKYEYKIISFILPGLIEEGEDLGATIADVPEDERPELAKRDFGVKPLCNWKEIASMHASGLVDIQSHGMFHELISISSKIIDFIHPDYDAYHYGNIHIPVYSDGKQDGLRSKVLGHPVYENAPRLSGMPRYYDPVSLRKACATYVQENGGVEYFNNPDWRRRLITFVNTFRSDQTDSDGSYESESSINKSIMKELEDSRKAIESHLQKEVTHFCFPWFKASGASACAAYQCGYHAIHLGATAGYRTPGESGVPVQVTRVQEEYLYNLPGNGRHPMYRTWMNKLANFRS